MIAPTVTLPNLDMEDPTWNNNDPGAEATEANQLNIDHDLGSNNKLGPASNQLK